MNFTWCVYECLKIGAPRATAIFKLDKTKTKVLILKKKCVSKVRDLISTISLWNLRVGGSVRIPCFSEIQMVSFYSLQLRLYTFVEGLHWVGWMFVTSGDAKKHNFSASSGFSGASSKWFYRGDMKVKTNRERIFQTYRKAPPLHLHLNMVWFRMVCCFVSRCFGVLRRWLIAGLDAAYQDRIRYIQIQIYVKDTW